METKQLQDMSVCINEYIFVGGMTPRHHQNKYSTVLCFRKATPLPKPESTDPFLRWRGQGSTEESHAFIVIPMVPTVAPETILLQKLNLSLPTLAL